MREQKSSSGLWSSSCNSSREPEACLQGAPSQACRATSSPSGASSSDDGEDRFAGDARDTPNETLEQFLQSELAGRRGWDPLLTAVNFLSIGVDVRSLGWMSIDDPAQNQRFRAFVHTMRAAIQAYLLPEFPNPALAREAERYLASGPTGIAMFAPSTAVGEGEERPVLASGFIATGVHGWGDSSRISSVRTLITRILRILEPLSQNALDQDLALANQYLAAKGPSQQSEGLTKSEQIALLVLASFMCGFCLDVLREQGFQWRLDTQGPRLYRETYAALESGRVGELDHELRTERLQRIAENIVRGAFKALGLKIPQDLLRDRRSERTS